MTLKPFRVSTCQDARFQMLQNTALYTVLIQSSLLHRMSTVVHVFAKAEIIVNLYNNQINVRALIGQSAVGYCAGEPTEKSHVF